jgi:hypothetical protein
MTINFAGLITFIEKLGAYFAVGGVGAANVGSFPTPIRVALTLAGALAVIEDRRSAVGVLPPSTATTTTTTHPQAPVPPA